MIKSRIERELLIIELEVYQLWSTFQIIFMQDYMFSRFMDVQSSNMSMNRMKFVSYEKVDYLVLQDLFLMFICQSVKGHVCLVTWISQTNTTDYML